ncbi:MAG: hypothetical protein KY464_05540 [Gemmatimonadetes bacterium]|nr:hypothetical protein [Gemmatimonadota bacterium]
MQHLSEETLARLVDEAAVEGEALHLETCEDCRIELEEMKAQTRALALLPEITPPAVAWPSVRRRLSAEELLRAAAGRRTGLGWPLRAAAGLTLFLAGAATGALALRGTAPGEQVAAAPTQPVAEADDLEQRLRAAEDEYVAVLTEYSMATESADPVDPLNRLAALEGIVLTTRAALEEAPADPVINGYHLSAVGQRDAMLRQIDDRDNEEPWF